MLERRRTGQPCRLPQLVHQLPGSQRIEQVDIARPTVKDAQGYRVLWHEQACRCLVRVTAISESHFHTPCLSYRYPISKRPQDAALAVRYRNTLGGGNPMVLAL